MKFTNTIVDIYGIDENTLLWQGTENGVYGSSAKNLLGLEEGINKFRDNFIPTLFFFKDEIFNNIQISDIAYNNYLGNELVKRGFPVISISTESVENGKFVQKIEIADQVLRSGINGL